MNTIACPTCLNSEDSRHGYCVTCRGHHCRPCDACVHAFVPATTLTPDGITALCAACDAAACDAEAREFAEAFAADIALPLPPALPRELRATMPPPRRAVAVNPGGGL